MTTYKVTWGRTPTQGQVKALDASCCTDTVWCAHGWYMTVPENNVNEIIAKCDELGISIEDLERA